MKLKNQYYLKNIKIYKVDITFQTKIMNCKMWKEAIIAYSIQSRKKKKKKIGEKK